MRSLIPLRTGLVMAVAGALAAAPPPAAAQDADTAYEEAADGSDAPAQVSFEEALAPYGQWADSTAYGRVWLPAAGQDPSWQPYTAGQWIWTSEYGWYFAGDEPFGWVVYHYGRWISDRTHGWIWIPGDVWGPAWVAWRQGDDFLGWTPLPPENGYDVEAIPELWTFVATSTLLRPDIRRHCLPRAEARDRFLASRYADRARNRAGAPIGFNPGIAATVIANAAGSPVRAREIRPRFYPGTFGLVDGRRVLGRRDDDVRRPHRDALPDGQGPTVQPYGRPAVRLDPAAGNGPQINSLPITGIPRPPVERPVPQPPSEGRRPIEQYHPQGLPPSGQRPPQIQQHVQPQAPPPVQQPQMQQQPMRTAPQATPAPPAQAQPQPRPQIQTQPQIQRLTPLNQQRQGP